MKRGQGVDDEAGASEGRGRVIRLIALIYLAAVFFGIWGYAAGRYGIFPYRLIEPHCEGLITLFNRGTLSTFDIQRRSSRFDYCGFNHRDTDFTDPGYLLVSRFSAEHDQVVVDLVRLGDFKKLHTWVPPVDTILDQTPPYDSIDTRAEYRVQHPLLLSGGDLVFHSGEGALVRIDSADQIVWTVNSHFHHSIEVSHDGNLVVPIVNSPDLFSIPTRNDAYAVVTRDGRIVERRSVGRILMDNGYRGLIFGVGKFEPDRFHLNDVQPVLRDVGDARTGDVALSVRNLSTVFLYRPSEDRVVWLKTGPWLNQHDVNLLGNGQYSVFGNDMCRIGSDYIRTNETSEIYILDPARNSIITPFTGILRRFDVYTAESGRSKILANGDAYIEETESSRLLRFSSRKIRWEYVNGSPGGSTVGALHWSRYLTAEEMEQLWKEKM